MSELPGIYLHYPFCERKCPYCDFYTFGREHPLFGGRGAFIEALLAEIADAPRRLGLAERPAVDTVYFGGGTPSLIGPAALERVLAALGRTFQIAPGAEITLEINPTTAETAGLPDLLALGVNRLSVGAQSFSDALLKRLGRVHDAATTRQALELMRRAGCANLSLDLIFGVPGQTLAMFEADLDAALSFAPEHISAYGLTLHDGTPFARWRAEGRLPGLPDEDAQAAMFERLMDRLAAAGHEHYEISNWAARRGGRALVSRHNSKYWRRADIIALGPGAHGVLAGRRTANPADLREYLDVAHRALARPLDAPAGGRASAGEVMMLALRRVAGAPWDELREWTGAEARELYRGEIARLSADGLIAADANGIRLTRRGIMLADSVMEEFF